MHHRCVAIRSSANLFAAYPLVSAVIARLRFSHAAPAATSIDGCNLEPKMARLEVDRLVPVSLAVRQLRKPLS